MQKVQKDKLLFVVREKNDVYTITNALWHFKCLMRRCATFKKKIDEDRKEIEFKKYYIYKYKHHWLHNIQCMGATMTWHWADWKLHKRKACNSQNWWNRASKNIIYKCKYYKREILRPNKQDLAEERDMTFNTLEAPSIFKSN